MDDPYDDDAPDMENKSSMASSDKTDEGEEDSEALLPKSFFKGEVQPGHKCTIEITHVGEDECMVKYSDSSSKSDSSEPMGQRQKSSDSLRKIAMQGEG